MQFYVLTLFPDIINSAASGSILGKALGKGVIIINAVDIRDYATDKHRMVDDYPYGGGPGMVMKPEPICEAYSSLSLPEDTPLLLLTPQGQRFDHAMARELAQSSALVLLCGRYEGIDDRIRNLLPVREVSLGDFILTGGEFAALAIMDAVARFVPRVLGHEESASDESFATGLLEYPHYTRPPDYRGRSVPEVLLSGDHGRVELWRRRQALLRTLQKRPDLLETAELTDDDRKFLENAQKSKNFKEEGEK